MKIDCKKLLHCFVQCNRLKTGTAISVLQTHCHLKISSAFVSLTNNRLTEIITVKFCHFLEVNTPIEFWIDKRIVNNLKSSDFVTITKTDSLIVFDFDDGTTLKYKNIDSEFYEQNIVYNHWFQSDKKFISDLATASRFTTTDEMRPAITGVNIITHTEGETITCSASDGHKLISFRNKVESQHYDLKHYDVVFTKRFCTLLGAYKKVNEFDFWITPIGDSKKCVMCKFESVGYRYEIKTRLITQQYPDFKAVIPQPQPNALIFKKHDMLKALNSVMQWTNEITKQITILWNEKQMTNICKSFSVDDGESITVSIPFERKGECASTPFGTDETTGKIAFNSVYLKQIISECENEIELSFEKAHKPFVIHYENKTLLIMPVILY